jgi:hypothetical protein
MIDAPETVAKAYCSPCGGERNCDILGSHRVQEDSGPVWSSTNWRILRCRGCDEVFCQTVSVFSEDYDQGYDDDGQPYQRLNETKKYWPAPAKRTKPEWFDDLHRIESVREKLADPLAELYGALNADLPMLSGVAVRTCFELVAEHLGVDGKLPFKGKIAELVKLGKLGSSAEEAISTAVEAGHAATHRGWVPEPDDLKLLVDILESFIADTLIAPARAQRLGENAARLKKRVPPDHRRKSNGPKPLAEPEGRS